MEKNIIKVKIVRHSERLDFSNPLYWSICIGQYMCDTPLTKNGYLMAKDKAIDIVNQGYIPDKIYVSPYSRTLSTATEMNKIFKISDIIIEPLFAEYQYYKHTINLYPDGIPTDYKGTDTKFSYPENISQFSDRIQFIMGKMLEKESSDFMIVTHGEVIKICIDNFQKKYPEININGNHVPFLTILSFDYDKIKNRIIPESIKIET
jgi:broad specificity phosphatase PhoE